MLEAKKDGNIVKIVGLLNTMDVKEGKSGAGEDYVSAKITIKVNQPINKVMTALEIPVEMFAKRLTKMGKSNPAYENIINMRDTYHSVSAFGEADADCVEIRNGQIAMNEYYNQAGALVSFPRVSTSFINKATKETPSEATFKAIFMVGDAKDEVDREGCETGRYVITGALPKFGGRVDVVKFHAINPGVIDVIRSWSKGDTVRVCGVLNFSSTTVEVESNVDFGDPVIEKRTKNTSEFVITGGSATPLEDGAGYDPNDIATAMKERQTYLDSLKDKTSNKPGAATKALPDLGF